MESREDMDIWQQCLETALKEPSSRAREETDEESEQGACAGCESNRREDMGERRKQVKQKLLEEMLRQKHELEKKQAERHKKQKNKDPDSPDRSPNSSYLNELTTEDQRTSDVTRLRQRRMSTQLKVETIQKQIVKPSQTKRSIFSFGKSKKLDENKNIFLQDQLKELNEKLHKIDTDLNQVEHDKPNTLDVFDVNQNKKRVSPSTAVPVVGDISDTTVDNDEEKRASANGIKSTMQKWTNKTFNKSSTKRKQNQVPQNANLLHTSSVPNLNIARSNGDLVNGIDCVDHGGSDTTSEDLLSSLENSVTDLTRPTSDLRLDLTLSYNGSTGSGSPRYARSNSRSSTVSTLSSPRREINPSVLAEIDAFEELTRQVLGARSKELPTK